MTGRWGFLRDSDSEAATLTVPCPGSGEPAKAVWEPERGQKRPRGLCERCGILAPLRRDGTLHLHRAPGEKMWQHVAR